MTFRKYEIWHDENKENGYHHGILFVPLDKKDDLIKYLKQIRDEHSVPYDNDLKFSGALKSKQRGRIVSNNLALFSHIIKTKIDQSTKLYNQNGKFKYKKEFNHFLELNDLFGCRFGFLRIEDNMQSLYFDSYAKKVETTLRFLLKGCCHGMFDDLNTIEIMSLYFDGNEHHVGGFDIPHILKGDFRPYCKVPTTVNIDARQIKDRNDDTKLIMNLVDNVVGAIVAVINEHKDENMVLYPLREIHKRVVENMIFTNKNSKWYKSISVSEFKLVDDQITFPSIYRSPDQGVLIF